MQHAHGIIFHSHSQTSHSRRERTSLHQLQQDSWNDGHVWDSMIQHKMFPLFMQIPHAVEAEGGFTLVSVDQNSSALIKPVEHSTPKRGKRMDEKKMDECPQQTCNISNYRRHTIHWVTCDRCGQWFHQYCVGLNPSKLKKIKSWLCATCIG